MSAAFSPIIGTSLRREAGIRAMCAWDRFRTFAREPERRRVGIDARVQVDGVSYEVDPSLGGETVTLFGKPSRSFSCYARTAKAKRAA